MRQEACVLAAQAVSAGKKEDREHFGFRENAGGTVFLGCATERPFFGASRKLKCSQEG